MKKKFIPFIVYISLAVILLILIVVVGNRPSYGLAALEDLGYFILFGLLLIADVFIFVVHCIILLILHIRRKKREEG